MLEEFILYPQNRSSPIGAGLDGPVLKGVDLYYYERLPDIDLEVYDGEINWVNAIDNTTFTIQQYRSHNSSLRGMPPRGWKAGRSSSKYGCFVEEISSLSFRNLVLQDSVTQNRTFIAASSKCLNFYTYTKQFKVACHQPIVSESSEEDGSRQIRFGCGMPYLDILDPKNQPVGIVLVNDLAELVNSEPESKERDLSSPLMREFIVVARLKNPIFFEDDDEATAYYMMMIKWQDSEA